MVTVSNLLAICRCPPHIQPNKVCERPDIVRNGLFGTVIIAKLGAKLAAHTSRGASTVEAFKWGSCFRNWWEIPCENFLVRTRLEWPRLFGPSSATSTIEQSWAVLCQTGTLLNFSSLEERWTFSLWSVLWTDLNSCFGDTDFAKLFRLSRGSGLSNYSCSRPSA